MSFLLVEYSITDTLHEFNKVTIEHFYKFLDKNRNNLIKYRKKDGNLRPKKFDAKSKFNSYEDFEKLFLPTLIFRAKAIIKQHFDSLPLEIQKTVLENLQKSLN